MFYYFISRSYTNGRAYATVLRLSSTVVCLSSVRKLTECRPMAKWCVLQQKLVSYY